MALGAAVGTLGVLAIAGHLGLAGLPWLVNVALIKLSLVAAGGLMVTGAATVRLDRRREQQRIELATRSGEGI